jgi:transposase
MNTFETVLTLPEIKLAHLEIVDNQLIIFAYPKKSRARCPCCNMLSHSVHSRYTRKLLDLPITDTPVSIHLNVRKFYCYNKNCKKKIFSEQPGSEISRYARMTERVKLRLVNVLVETSCRKGSKLSEIIQTPISPSKALRIIYSLPMKCPGEIKTLGVDDWAYRKGVSYGTILVNMDTGKAIDILSGRDGKELKVWLKSHPGIQHVCRDRSSAYSAAVSETRPTALQVADRFHLVKNLSDSVYEIIRSEYSDIINSLNTNEQVHPESNTPKESIKEKPIQERINGECSNYRKELFFSVKEFIEKGNSHRAIANKLQISRITVIKYAGLSDPPLRARHFKIDYHKYLHVIEQELSNGKTLSSTYRKIVDMGFKGTYTSFNMQFKNHPKYKKAKENTKANALNTAGMLSPRRISIDLSLTDLERIKSEPEKLQINSLISSNSLVRALRDLMLNFRKILSKGTPHEFNQWMENALLLGKKKLNTLVNGMKMDIEAIYNAITTSLSSGMVEGNVNRLKNIKRQMYGRASFELLKRKVILSKTG